MAPQRTLLEAGDVKQVMHRYLERLRQHREALNRLNVYPVPDGDTGTNMTLTIESVVEAAGGAESMEQLAAAIAEGSLMGAQGNSGIILSQILRGIADAFREEPSVGCRQLVDALDRASAAAYKAVGKPVEGTILTVLREAAEAAAEAETPAGEDLAQLLERVYRRGEKALAATPDLLPVLKQAGVVDAGGAGFLLLLVAFLEEVTGEDVVLPEAIFAAAAIGMIETTASEEHASMSGPRYEVMFLLRSETDDAGDRLRSAWAEWGDSIVVVGGSGVWNCHIHTDAIGASIEVGVSLGTPERIAVTDLREQVEDEAFHRQSFQPLADFADAEPGVVAVGVGDGVVDLFRDAGAQGFVRGGQTDNPAVRDLLEVVEAVAAGTVIVLPNNKNIVPVAEQLDALSTKRVLVMPTQCVPEGLAAMMAYVPGADPDGILAGMRDAVSSMSWGEVTQAVRDASTPAGEIREGQWLGIVDGAVSVVAEDEVAASVGVLAALVDASTELVTVLVGADASDEATQAIKEHVLRRHPDVTVSLIPGGQPLYPYSFGVE